MRNPLKSLITLRGRAWREQDGITGLETAIVLIAFVVVAAVFAFAVITTGLFSPEQAAESATAGIGEAATTLTPKGAAIVREVSTGNAVHTVSFKLTNSAGADSVDLAAANTLVTYIDDNQVETLVNSGGAAADAWWAAEWKPGAGDALDEGEVVEITVGFYADGPGASYLSTVLGTNTNFRVEIIPSQGAPFTLTRKTPAELKTIMNLN